MAEDQTMTDSEAVNELNRFINIFRAAEHLKGVLESAVSAQGRKTELETANKTLEEQHAKTAADLEAKAESLVAKEKELADYEAELEQKKAEAKAKFDADMEELGKHYSEVSVGVRDKVKDEIKAEQQKVDELLAQKSDLQRDVRMLEAEVNALVAKKAAL